MRPRKLAPISSVMPTSIVARKARRNFRSGAQGKTVPKGQGRDSVKMRDPLADDPPRTPQRFYFSRDYILESVDVILVTFFRKRYVRIGPHELSPFRLSGQTVLLDGFPGSKPG